MDELRGVHYSKARNGCLTGNSHGLTVSIALMIPRTSCELQTARLAVLLRRQAKSDTHSHPWYTDAPILIRQRGRESPQIRGPVCICGYYRAQSGMP